MITLSKVRSSTIEQGKRILKVLQFGVKTAKEAGPFGFDSSPLENWTAIYSETSNKGDSVIIGYINKNQLSTPGESRIFSLDSGGFLASSVVLRTTGVIELNGAEFSAVRFEELKTAIDAQNELINAEFAKISISIGTLGGIYTPGEVSADLSTSQSETIKLK